MIRLFSNNRSWGPNKTLPLLPSSREETDRLTNWLTTDWLWVLQVSYVESSVFFFASISRPKCVPWIYRKPSWSIPIIYCCAGDRQKRLEIKHNALCISYIMTKLSTFSPRKTPTGLSVSFFFRLVKVVCRIMSRQKMLFCLFWQLKGKIEFKKRVTVGKFE